MNALKSQLKFKKNIVNIWISYFRTACRYVKRNLLASKSQYTLFKACCFCYGGVGFMALWCLHKVEVNKILLCFTLAWHIIKTSLVATHKCTQTVSKGAFNLAWKLEPKFLCPWASGWLLNGRTCNLNYGWH